MLEGLGWLLILAIYLLPTFGALLRGKRNWRAIFLLNLLAGWTGIAWVGCLVWAMVADAPAAGGAGSK